MKHLLRDPLVHFALGGLILFVLVDFDTSPSDMTEDRIVVDRNALLTYTQFRMKTFEPEAIGEMFDALTRENLDRLAADYAREEALYREALALGLDKNDYVIRQRLVQKLRYIHEEIARVSASPDEDAVHDYFLENQGDYERAPAVTLTHVFFDSRKNGRTVAKQLALEKLDELKAADAQFSESTGHGDRFLFNRNYIETEPEQIRDHFDDAFAALVFDESTVTGEWTGPIESQHGFHLVMIAAISRQQLPEFDEVRDLVVVDAVRAASQTVADQSIDRLVDDYDVEYTYAN